MAWAATRALRAGGGGDGRCRSLHCARLACGKRATGQRCARGRRRDAVSVAKLILVGDRGHRRSVSGIGLGIHEYGWADWGRGHGIAYSVDRRGVWMDGVIPGGGGLVSARCSELAGGRSAEDADTNLWRIFCGERSRFLAVCPAFPYSPREFVNA